MAAGGGDVDPKETSTRAAGRAKSAPLASRSRIAAARAACRIAVAVRASTMGTCFRCGKNGHWTSQCNNNANPEAASRALAQFRQAGSGMEPSSSASAPNSQSILPLRIAAASGLSDSEDPATSKELDEDDPHEEVGNLLQEGGSSTSGVANPTSAGLTFKKKLSRNARRRARADMATRDEEERHAANSGTDHDGLSDPEVQTTSSTAPLILGGGTTALAVVCDTTPHRTLSQRYSELEGVGNPERARFSALQRAQSIPERTRAQNFRARLECYRLELHRGRDPFAEYWEPEPLCVCKDLAPMPIIEGEHSQRCMNCCAPYVHPPLRPPYVDPRSTGGEEGHRSELEEVGNPLRQSRRSTAVRP